MTTLLGDLESIGRNRVTGGVDRLAWSTADLALREWFLARAAALGLDTETDGNGNLWAWWGHDLPGTAVVIGSHLDSVPSGGNWDGPLGVVSAFLAVERLQASGARPRRPVAVVSFSDEEGGRFGAATLGSRLLTGAASAETALGLRDVDGTTLAEAMRAAGHDPARVATDPERLARIGAYIELHVEQGHLPIAEGAHAGATGLAAAGVPLGVASEIWPHGRWRLDFRGVANHAGTTPLADRTDPVLAMARAITEVRAAAERLGVLGTVGKLAVVPGAVNAIASTASCWVDARGADPARVRALIAEVENALASSLDGAAAEESWTAVTPFDRDLTAAVAAASASAVTSAAAGASPIAGELPVLPSGAGHDAGVLALAGVPTAMLFVRNPTGVSHSPEERADEADARLAVDALTAVLQDQAMLTGAPTTMDTA